MANKKNAAVINYISILFMAAFFLMMMTYLMEQREVAENIQGLRNSVSAMQSVDELYAENMDLLAEQQALQEEIRQLEEDNITYAITNEQMKVQILDLVEAEEAYAQQLDALTALWAVEKAYAYGQEDQAMAGLLGMEEDGSYYALSREGDFSPAETYVELCWALLDRDPS